MPAVREWLKASSGRCADARGSLARLGLAFGLVSCGGPTTPGGPVMDLHLSSDASSPGTTAILDSGASEDSSTEDASTDDAGPGMPTDSGTSHDSGTPDGAFSAPGTTTAGVTLPAGWTLKISDRFGTGATSTVSTLAALHAKYYESQYYNRTPAGLVKIPNVVINNEQETYSHFETVIAFASDHLTIQGRGHADGSITSGEMVSVYTARSFCTEARYQIPSADKSWPAFWFYAGTSGGDSSELDVEQPITPNQGVHAVSLYNHPNAATLDIVDTKFTSNYMTWTNAAFDGSTAPHDYTTCYDDAAGTVSRYIDAHVIYTTSWKWNASLGGTGFGPDATAIVNLAVGGSWPGNLATPASYSGDLDVYSIEYYGP